MSGPDPDPQPTFTRRSEKESICTYCFLPIRGDEYMTLDEAERIHAEICLFRPASALRYAAS
ncbi:MAG TPA: hypothetical protein VL240_08175 [Candidatus Binatia bacterium]|nr:hypothetical protein [Candidatus Binatia bacterium]